MAIGRRTVNVVRYVLEDLLPPALRDSPLFRPLIHLAFGRDARRFIAFRERARTMSAEEYAWFYTRLKPVMGETDLNRACLDALLGDVTGDSVADIGCGRGFLIRRIAALHPQAGCLGVDIDPPQRREGDPANLAFEAGWLGRLPFDDGAFDTLVCSHTLEHVPDLAAALADLRRIARRRLIIVVPREREYRYAFNLHLHFFPYVHSFLNRIAPPEGRFECRLLGGDIYYREDREG